MQLKRSGYVPPRECHHPGHQDHADEQGNQPGTRPRQTLALLANMAARDQASCLPEVPVARYATQQGVLTSGKQVSPI
jgi:hypothetical protein